MADGLAPILLSLEARPGGYVEAVWSVRPGRRVRMLVAAAAATPDGLTEIAASVLPALERERPVPRI